MEALQSKHDDSKAFSAAKRGEIAKLEKVLAGIKDLRDKKSAYETRLMARDKEITELKLKQGDC